MLFFEKALSLLRPGGRLVFITPEKYLYVQSAEALRRLLAGYAVEELEFVDERAFGDVLAYPLITVVRKAPPSGPTIVTLRDGRRVEVQLPRDGAPWLPAIFAGETPRVGGCVKLGMLAERVSAGVATGRDEVFVAPREAVPQELRAFAYPTVSGTACPPVRIIGGERVAVRVKDGQKEYCYYVLDSSMTSGKSVRLFECLAQVWRHMLGMRRGQ
jgi:hypothetical protein